MGGAPTLPRLGSRVRIPSPAPDRTLSAISRTAKKPNCRRVLRIGLGGSRAERYAESLSESRILSEAWGLAELLYKLFSLTFQRSTLIAQSDGWYPFAPISARPKASNLSPRAPGRNPSPPPPHTRSPHTGRIGNNPAQGHAVACHADPPRGSRRHRRARDVPQCRDWFWVLRVKARGHRDLITIVGHTATISAGKWITASGDWVNDRIHGQQFKVCFLPAPQAERGQLAGKRCGFR